MRKIILLSFAILFALSSFAQQDQQYTQFMYNKLSYNPAYAGSMGLICATGIMRSQWLGLEGAPNTQLISMDASFYERRVGLGVNLVRHNIGVSDRYDFDAAYAYHVEVGKGMLGIGIQGTARYLKANFADERIIAIQAASTDASIPMGMQTKLLPNFGFGLYYNDDRTYVGLSAPRLIENNIDFLQESAIISREVRHLYLMGGYLMDLSEDVQFHPQLLVKYAQNVPLDVDVNLSAILSGKYVIGATFRVGGSTDGAPIESVDLLFSAQLRNNLIFGISYDVTVSALKSYNSGSLEAMVRYCFKGIESGGKKEQEEFMNPRFF